MPFVWRFGRYRDLEPLDLFLQVQMEQQQRADFLPVIARAPVRLLFDHCGRPDPAAGLDQPRFQARLFPDPEERRRLFWDNPRRIFGFDF